MNAIEEAKHAPAVAAFVRAFNRRCIRRIQKDQTWVRMTPPEQADFDACKQDPRLLPFLRVGSFGEVVDVSQKYITIRIGGDAVMFTQEAFLQTFTRAVAGSEWHR
jgi:hypothetical protein